MEHVARAAGAVLGPDQVHNCTRAAVEGEDVVDNHLVPALELLGLVHTSLARIVAARRRDFVVLVQLVEATLLKDASTPLESYYRLVLSARSSAGDVWVAAEKVALVVKEQVVVGTARGLMEDMLEVSALTVVVNMGFDE